MPMKTFERKGKALYKIPALPTMIFKTRENRFINPKKITEMVLTPCKFSPTGWKTVPKQSLDEKTRNLNKVDMFRENYSVINPMEGNPREDLGRLNVSWHEEEMKLAQFKLNQRFKERDLA